MQIIMSSSSPWLAAPWTIWPLCLWLITSYLISCMQQSYPYVVTAAAATAATTTETNNDDGTCDVSGGTMAQQKSVSQNPRYDPLRSNHATSESSRRMASIGQVMTYPSGSSSTKNTATRRAKYPESEPHICLALLSCCDRIDLLHHTIEGVVRHMEFDEPKELRYEIAWVDNGSDRELTQSIVDTYQIEHALRLPTNMGLAYGMNLLMRNLCTAPYILLLEEDWLYLDELVAPQTTERQRVIATSVALLESLEQQDIRAYDQRKILGIFLRHESYETFLKFPHSDVWERHYIPRNFTTSLPRSMTTKQKMIDSPSTNDDEENINSLPVDYRIFCADIGLQGDSIWGSYTNGAGLYRRSDLIHGIGRMYGEPGDAFHDRYVEGNFAFRAALLYCHTAIRLTSDTTCTAIDDAKCAGAFHHIGGGRGTRPRTTQGTKCANPAWNFFGTPLYDKYLKMVELANGGIPMEICSAEELQELRDIKFHELDAQDFREQVARDNEEVFEQEQREREKTKAQARTVLQLLNDGNAQTIRAQVPWMASMTEEEIRVTAERMLKLMDSPHPLQGFWDSHGRVIGSEEQKRNMRDLKTNRE